MRVISIAGPSGAGKSYLAQAICDAGIRQTSACISLDHYYHDLSHLDSEARATSNFDDPGAVDHQHLISQLTDLLRGLPIQRPCYDFATHTRKNECALVMPADLLVLEGLFALSWPELRDLFSLSIFVDAPDTLCLQRRVARDVEERGRTEESVQEQYAATVRPMAQRHILPTRQHADLVIPGDAPVAQSIDLIRKHFDAARQSSHPEGCRR